MNYNISTAYFRGYHFLDKVSQSREKSMEKLSSGYRINCASDDSAGSAMTSIMRSQIRGLQQANRNSDDGIELLNSAESGLEEITTIMQRIRELSVRSANDTLTPADRTADQQEIDHLLTEIDRIAKTTEYNGIKLLNNESETAELGIDSSSQDGNAADNSYTSMKIQAGANAYQVVDINLPFISVKELGIQDIDIQDNASATEALTALDNAIQYVTLERSKLGTYRNRLEHVSNIDDISALATTDSESKIHDVDFSSEILNLTKAQVVEEYGVNSVTEINKMIENVLNFIK